MERRSKKNPGIANFQELAMILKATSGFVFLSSLTLFLLSERSWGSITLGVGLICFAVGMWNSRKSTRIKYPDEDYAIDLHHDLTQQFASTEPPTVVSIKGGGVNWHCTVERSDSLCEIYCFETWDKKGHQSPEYLISLVRKSKEIATARINSKIDVAKVVTDWLEGCELSEIYGRYPFVDHDKRELLRIKDGVFKIAPDLKTSTTLELKHWGSGIYYHNFITPDRSCEISFYGKNEHPDAKFTWDKCQLFQFQVKDEENLAKVMQRWLCDNAKPSEMNAEFPWLEIGELADFYEAGKPIEGEFLASWNFIEEFYKDCCPFSAPVLKMISEIRTAGYDKNLRAGQSLYTLGLSRSRRHNLREGQKCIWFDFSNNEMDVYSNLNTGELKKHPIKFTEEVKQLLDELAENDID